MTAPVIPLAVDTVGAVQAWLQGRFPLARAVTETPGDLVAALPVYKVAQFGGPMQRNLTGARIEVQAFAVNAPAARAAAISAASAMCRDMPGTTTNGVVVTAVDVNSSLATPDYENPNVRRAVVLLDVYCHPAP